MVVAVLTRHTDDPGGARRATPLARPPSPIRWRSPWAHPSPTAAAGGPTGAGMDPASPPFAIETLLTPDALVLRVCGELDIASVPELADVAAGAVRWLPARLVIDVSELRFVDLTGLHCLVLIRRRALAVGVAFHLRHPAPAVLRTIDLAGYRELRQSAEVAWA